MDNTVNRVAFDSIAGNAVQAVRMPFPPQIGFVPFNPPNNRYARARPADDDDTSSSSESVSSPPESDLSDCESTVSASGYDPSSAQNDRGLLQILQGDKAYGLVAERFLSSLGLIRAHTQISALYKNAYSEPKAQGIVEDFKIWQKRMEQKNGGSANVKTAWCGVSKDEMIKIVRRGFRFGVPKNDGSYGQGVYLSPGHSPLESVKNAVVDEDGLRHVILCRVILGKTEVIQPGSQQDGPSSSEFDSGVDSSLFPSKYIIWSFDANAYILPEFVLSFRAPSLEGLLTPQVRKMPTSPWLPFTGLISALAEFLPPSDINSLNEDYKELKERKLTRHDMIKRLRQLAGDKLLVSVIKSLGLKTGGGMFRRSPHRLDAV